MLILAIIALIFSIVLFFILALANGMSDAPSQAGISLAPAVVVFVISIGLFILWWSGFHLNLISRG